MNTVVILKLAGVVAVLLALIFLKVKPEYALTASAAVLIILYGKGLKGFVSAFEVFVKSPDTWTLPLVVLLLSILGSVMGKTGMLKKMTKNLLPMVRSTKLTIMMTPVIIGLLAVTGGAYISCPLVDELGNSLNISAERKAAINLVYRHCIHFAYPLNSSLLVAAQLSGIPALSICALTFPVVFIVMALGHVLFMRGIDDVVLPKEEPKVRLRHTGLFFLNFAPIMVALILAIVFSLPMWISLVIGIILAVVICNLQDDTKPQEKLVPLLFKKVNYRIVFVIFAALFFRACIMSVGEIAESMNALAKSGLPVEVIIILICVITAYPTGSVQTPAAILLPILLTITSDYTLLRLYTSLTLIVSIYSYFFSPVHMCQLLSIEYFGTDLRSLLKEYGIFIPLFGVGIAAWYIVTKMIVL